MLGLLAPQAGAAPSVEEEEADFDLDATRAVPELEDQELEAEQELRLARPE